MATGNVSLAIEPSDSPRLQRQKREVTKLQEFDKLLFLKKEKAELEAKKMRTCFYSSEPKYRKSITYKNKSYQVPKFWFFAGCCGASHPRPITIHQGAHS